MPRDRSGFNVGELIRARTASFTPAEHRLARALLASYPTAGLEPLSQLAARAGVSPPTALRLVAKLGFDGYPAFQRQLREEVQLRIDSPAKRYWPMTHAVQGPDSALPEFGPLLSNLEATADALDIHEFNSVVELLADSRRQVVVLGGLVSRILARHLVLRLIQLRPGVRLSPEGSPWIFDQVVDLKRRDVVVAFDYKRYQWDTNAFLRRVARQRTTVILCTDTFHLCPALDIATHVLTFSVEGPPPFDSPIGGFALVEALASCLAARLGEAGRARIAELELEDSDWMWDRRLLKERVTDPPEHLRPTGSGPERRSENSGADKEAGQGS